MPIYEFQCQACDTIIEVLQKINDPHITDCEACGKAEMKKKVTAAAFRLSGAGWYETDFKEGDKKKNLTETSSDGSAKDSSEGSSKDSSQDSSQGRDQKSDDTKKVSKDSTDKGSDKNSDKTSSKTETSATESKAKTSKESKKD